MEVAEFQELLNNICKMAQENGKKLTQEQLRACFLGAGLDSSQMTKVLQYLQIKGISIEGMEQIREEKAEEETCREPEGSGIPLTPREQEYLQEYLSGLEAAGTVREREQLFLEYREGLESGKQGLARSFMRDAAQLAAEMNCEELPLADLIQEANICLLTALEAGNDQADDAWLRGEIQKGLCQVIQENSRRKFEDDCLVAKVENLESAVRELTEDEEGEEPQFSVEELAIILDMDVEEIRGVLRLTGDDK